MVFVLRRVRVRLFARARVFVFVFVFVCVCVCFFSERAMDAMKEHMLKSGFVVGIPASMQESGDDGGGGPHFKIEGADSQILEVQLGYGHGVMTEPGWCVRAFRFASARERISRVNRLVSRRHCFSVCLFRGRITCAARVRSVFHVSDAPLSL